HRRCGAAGRQARGQAADHGCGELHSRECRGGAAEDRALIALQGVSKTYRTLLGRRPVRAVEEFSLQTETGEIFGIAGPNGAGKSTLINMLLGFLAPTSGSATIAGMAPRAYVET